MGFERLSTWGATALAAALAMASAPAAGGEPAQSCGTREAKISPRGSVSRGFVRHDTAYEHDSDGCTVTLHESRYPDGSSRSVEQTVCDDGAVRTLERHLDAEGWLAYVSEHEITADGVVRLVEDSDEGTAVAAASNADHERIQDWLDAKFREWNADVEAREAAHSRH